MTRHQHNNVLYLSYSLFTVTNKYVQTSELYVQGWLFSSIIGMLWGNLINVGIGKTI